MELGLRNKLALVTGGGRGIGKAVVLSLAQEGAKICAVSRTAQDLHKAVEEAGGSKAGHLGISIDLMKDKGPSMLAAKLKSVFGYPDIIVHNLGGTMDINDPFCSMSDWRKVLRFNLEIAIELNLLLVPSMRKKRWGRIVHIASISALENHGPVTYCTAKAGLVAYTRSMGRVLAREGIAVTAVLPGAVYTEKGYWDTASKERPDHVKKYLEERMALGRFGTPDEISGIVAFLCSQKASFFVGPSIVVDGGQGRGF